MSNFYTGQCHNAGACRLWNEPLIILFAILLRQKMCNIKDGPPQLIYFSVSSALLRFNLKSGTATLTSFTRYYHQPYDPRQATVASFLPLHANFPCESTDCLGLLGHIDLSIVPPLLTPGSYTTPSRVNPTGMHTTWPQPLFSNHSSSH